MANQPKLADVLNETLFDLEDADHSLLEGLDQWNNAVLLMVEFQDAEGVIEVLGERVPTSFVLASAAYSILKRGGRATTDEIAGDLARAVFCAALRTLESNGTVEVKNGWVTILGTRQ